MFGETLTGASPPKYGTKNTNKNDSTPKANDSILAIIPLLLSQVSLLISDPRIPSIHKAANELTPAETVLEKLSINSVIYNVHTILFFYNAQLNFFMTMGYIAFQRYGKGDRETTFRQQDH